MKQAKVLLLALTVLITAVMVSCAPGQGQAAGGWSGTAFHDGIIYTGTQDGRVVAVNATTRELLWSHAFEVKAGGGLGCGPSSVPDAIYTTPIVDGDLVYVGTYSGKIIALNTVARGLDLDFPRRVYGEWVASIESDAADGAIVADLVFCDDVIYVTSSDGRVRSLTQNERDDKDPGDSIWQSERLAQKLWTSPTIVADTLYLSTFDGHIYALSAETGKTLGWSVELEGGLASSPVVHDGIIYVGSFDNSLYAVKVADGEPLWTFTGRKWFWAAPIVHGGIVYAGCLDGTLYALDPETGQRLWDFDAGSPIVARPVIEDDHNVLIVAAESGSIYFFDLDAVPGGQSTPLKTVSVGAAIKSTFCAAEGFVYVRGED
ncbi:MAG: PQQ-binding-like beta-propeller repeat protein, partial [Dehalococcoidia bacterium]